MSRANSVERERKPLPPVPPENNTHSLADSTQTSATDRLAQTLKKMSEDIPTTEYRSPLNLAARIKNELADLTREIPVAVVTHSAAHDHRSKDKPRQGPSAASDIPADHQVPGEAESITSAEKIRRNWEESQKSPDRQPSHRHKSKPSKDAPRYKSTTAPPTAYRTGDGYPWTSHSRDHSRSRHPDDSHSHHRERSQDELRDADVYANSDESEPQTPVLEIHNATPVYDRESMKSKNRPGLTSRFRTSLQRIGVGSTRPAKQRADISRSPSPEDRGSRSPSPHTWRKPSPHSSIRANDQYATPHATRFPDTLPRIESQKMDLEWPVDNPQTPPQRPVVEALPTIPDLHSPGAHLENGPRTIQIIDGDKPRSTEGREQAPAHHMEKSDATTVTAVNPPPQREYFHDDGLVLHNVRGAHDVHEGRDIVPGRLKRLLSLSGRTVPIDGPDSPPSSSPPSVPRPKMSATPAGIIRSASLIRTRSRRKESSKTHERRVEPEVVHVDYESDGWGESPPVVRDAQGRIIPTAAPKRRGSLKNKTTGPTKIALPMGQVEEFHSVHSNSPTEAPKDLVSSVPMLHSEHKRTTSTTTFHTAQSEDTRPNTPARKLSNSSTRQAKTSGASESRHEGWRRSRAGAPRRPSQTLLATTTGVTDNQYADEDPLAHESHVAHGYEPEHHHTDRRDHHQDTSDSYFPPQPIPIIVHRSRSPVPQEQAVHFLPSQSPPIPARTPPPQRPPPAHSPPPVPTPSPPPPARSVPPQEISTPSPPPPLDPRSRSPPPLLEPGQSYTPPSQHSLHASPERNPPIQTPPAPTPPPEHREVHILPADNLPAEHDPYDVPRYQAHIETQVEPARTPQLDTPYVLPRMPTPTLTSPGVLLDRPSPSASPMIDRSAPPGPHTPPRSVHIEDASEAQPPSSEHPLPRPVTQMSGAEQQRRSQNRKTGSEMSFVTVEPLSKREKLAASMLSISSMPWLRGRLSSSRSHQYAESAYPSSHEEDDPRHHDRHDRYDRYDRPRQQTDYLPSPTAPQLPPMSHSPPPRPEVGKLPSWYPREQAARAAASSPLARDSRGPKIGHEAWGWRSSPDPHRFGIPEEPEESPEPPTMPPWPYAGGVVTSGPNLPNDVVRGESMMTPPILPARPAAPSSEATPQAGEEKKRMPKYRIEQDERGYPVLVPEPGFDDSRWTVFEIGGVQFKRAPSGGEGGKGAQWVPNRLSGRRPESRLSPLAYQYSDSPAQIHTGLEERRHDP